MDGGVFLSGVMVVAWERACVWMAGQGSIPNARGPGEVKKKRKRICEAEKKKSGGKKK